MDLNQVINTVKRRAESIVAILFYIAAGLCFFYYVGNFNGSFMPVMGTLISMVLEVGLWLLIPVLISIRRRSIAKWAFLGLSIFWALTTIFSLLQGTGLASAGASALSCATGVFCFLVACAMIVASVFAVLAYWKKDRKMKLIALSVYLGTLVLLLVLFALYVALYAGWGVGWNEYFGLLYSYIVIPVAMCFAALAFWFTEGELHFACFEKKPESKKEPEKTAEKESASEKVEEPAPEVKKEPAEEVKEEVTPTEEAPEEAAPEAEEAKAEDAPAEAKKPKAPTQKKGQKKTTKSAK